MSALACDRVSEAQAWLRHAAEGTYRKGRFAFQCPDRSAFRIERKGETLHSNGDRNFRRTLLLITLVLLGILAAAIATRVEMGGAGGEPAEAQDSVSASEQGAMSEQCTALEQYVTERMLATNERADDDFAQVEEALLSRTTCKVQSSDAESATVLITAPDMISMFDRMEDECDTQEECTAFLLDCLQSGDYSERSVTLDVVIGEDGVPEDSYAFADALYGGLLTKLAEIGERWENVE